MTDLQSLIFRLEQSTGPSRELDCEIALAIGWMPDNGLDAATVHWVLSDLRGSDSAHVQASAGGWGVPRYTGSLDAASTLMPAGYGWTVGHYRDCRDPNAMAGEAWIGARRLEAIFQAPTMPLAVCLCALKFREAHPLDSKETE